MERSWQRRQPFVELGRDELQARVDAALPGARLTDACPLSGGLRNTNYHLRVAAAGGPTEVVLRLYVADPSACCREAAILVSLDDVPAPRVLFADGDASPPFALLEWIDGQPLDEMLAVAAPAAQLGLAAECGRVLARIHEIRFTEPGFLGPALRVERPVPPLAGYVTGLLDGPLADRLGPSLAAAVRALVAERSAELDAADEAVLVHADFKPWNLLAGLAEDAPDAASRSSGHAAQIVGVLDWEFAFAGQRLFDVATFLRDEASRPAGFGEAFARGYRAAGGVLPDGWRQKARLLDLVNLCQLGERAGERQLADVRRLLERSLSST